MSTLGDNKGATTSYGAGRTYDGSAPASGSNPGGGNDIGMGGTPSQSAAAKSMPNTAEKPNDIKPVPTPTAVMAAPWQHAIDTAKTLMMIAAFLMLLGFAMKGHPWFKLIKTALSALVCVLGVMVIALGAQIAGGAYGQKSQGAVLAAAGLGLTIMGAAMLMDGEKSTFKGENTTGLEAGTANGPSAAQVDSTGVNGNTATGPDAANKSTGGAGLWGMNPMVALGGGIATMGLIGSMMMPLQKYPSTDFANGNPPDARFF